MATFVSSLNSLVSVESRPTSFTSAVEDGDELLFFSVETDDDDDKWAEALLLLGVIRMNPGPSFACDGKQIAGI